MKFYYWRTRLFYEIRKTLRTKKNNLSFCDANNFGDEMSYYLYSFLGKKFATQRAMLIGSLLQEYAGELVLGAGFISYECKDLESIKVGGFVRGKLSARKIHSICDYICDPGLLAADVFKVRSSVTRSKNKIVFIPHVSEVKNLLGQRISIPSHVKIILPTDHPRRILQKMADCQTVYSSSLHGLIFAHSLGIPSKHVEVSSMVIGGNFKFKDYYSVFQSIEYSPVRVESCDWKCLSKLTERQMEELSRTKQRLKEFMDL